MNTIHIAILPGDGIGPDVVAEGVKALRAVERRLRTVRFELTEHPAGAGEYLRSGESLPEATIEACRTADAVLLGAMGLPDVRRPDGKEFTPQIELRERLELYCGLRPVRLYHADDSPLKDRQAGDIDFVIVREQTEGLFSGRLAERLPEADAVRDVLTISRGGSRRVFRSAFELARRRRRHVTLVDKANVLPSMVFFREVFEEVARKFADVQTSRVYVDAAALYLVQRPQTFDVIVTENMFGDILSDLSAGLIGGMGMAPSGDIGENCAVFQPAHGSAPDIAGKGIANPIATILSVGLMLDWLDTDETRVGAKLVERAVETALSDPRRRTPDLGGTMTTSTLGDAVAEVIADVPLD